MDIEALKIKMRERKVDCKGIAKILGITNGSAYNKFEGTRPFSLKEAELISRSLRLRDEDAGRIFLRSPDGKGD